MGVRAMPARSCPPAHAQWATLFNLDPIISITDTILVLLSITQNANHHNKLYADIELARHVGRFSALKSAEL